MFPLQLKSTSGFRVIGPIKISLTLGNPVDGPSLTRITSGFRLDTRGLLEATFTVPGIGITRSFDADSCSRRFDSGTEPTLIGSTDTAIDLATVLGSARFSHTFSCVRDTVTTTSGTTTLRCTATGESIPSSINDVTTSADMLTIQFTPTTRIHGDASRSIDWSAGTATMIETKTSDRRVRTTALGHSSHRQKVPATVPFLNNLS